VTVKAASVCSWGSFCLICCALIGGCGPSPQTPPQAATPVVAATVEPADWGNGPVDRYTGTVRPHQQVGLAFRVGGYVRSLLTVRDATGGTRPVQAGDTVRAGTVLARLESVDFRAQSAAASAEVGVARAGVGQARGKLSQSQAAERQAAGAITEARAALQAAQAAHAQAVSGVGQSTAGVAEAQAAVSLAQSDFARTDDLYHNGSATRPQEDAARAALDGAVARHQAAVQAMAVAQGRVAEAGDDIRAARARVSRAQSDAVAGRAASAEAGAAITAAQAQVARADALQAAQRVPVAQTVLRAPITGVVMARSVEVGSLVGPGGPAFSLAETQRVDINFGLPELVVSRLRVGQRLGLTVGVQGTHVLGTVTEIAPAADEKTGVFGVQVTVPNPTGALRVGMTATLGLGGSVGTEGALSVPAAALVQSRDQPSGEAVFVIVAGNGGETVHSQDVRLGPSLHDRIVVHGLTPGTRVVADSPGLLYDGETVRVAAPEAGSR
jgi:RND family efflux transporter MFP subunit